MLVLAAVAMVLETLEPAPGRLRVDLAVITEARPLPEARAPRRSISAPWVIAPAVCQAVDVATAQWAHNHRDGWRELNMSGSIDKPARHYAIKAGAAVITSGVSYLVGRFSPAAGKVIAGGSCAWTLYGAGSNVGLWGYRGPRVGL